VYLTRFYVTFIVAPLKYKRRLYNSKSKHFLSNFDGSGGPPPPDHNLISLLQTTQQVTIMTSFGENANNKNGGFNLKFSEKKGFNPTSLPTTPFKFSMGKSSTDFIFGTSSTNSTLDKNDKEAFAKYTTDTRISVDVRGHIFKVSRDTLKKMVFFRNIIVSDENISSIFIDRSPSSFSHLLDLMVYESMDPSIDDFMKNKILLDMDYFGISVPDCMRTLGYGKGKIVDKKRTPICIGSHMSTLSIDHDTINDLDGLVEKYKPYTSTGVFGKGRCCINACLQGVKFQPSISSGRGILDRCVVLKTISCTGNPMYACSVHRHRMYNSDYNTRR